MSRKVKCQATGEFGTTDDFVKIDDKWYKSREVYDKVQREKEFRKRAKEIILNDFLHYEAGRPFPALLNKKYVELASFYSDEVICKTVEEIRENMIKCCESKDFKNEYNAVAYVFAAINSHIGDVYNQQKAEEKRREQLKKESEKVQLDLNILNDSLAPKSVPTYKSTRNLTNFFREEDL